jgi:hypothetical protein
MARSSLVAKAERWGAGVLRRRFSAASLRLPAKAGAQGKLTAGAEAVPSTAAKQPLRVNCSGSVLGVGGGGEGGASARLRTGFGGAVMGEGAVPGFGTGAFVTPDPSASLRTGLIRDPAFFL